MNRLNYLIFCFSSAMVFLRRLVGKCPNTYAYTKAIAEQLLNEDHGDIPLAIVRPSTVTAAMKEPMPGWIDNINGPTGIIAGVGKGFLRVVRSRPELVGDIIPVEFPIHLMIAVAWYTATTKYYPAVNDEKLCFLSKCFFIGRSKEVKVYNSSTGDDNPLNWGQFRTYGFEAWMDHPGCDMLWYPSISFISGEWTYKIAAFLFHYLPAYTLDFFMHLIGRQPKLVRFSPFY